MTISRPRRTSYLLILSFIAAALAGCLDTTDPDRSTDVAVASGPAAPITDHDAAADPWAEGDRILIDRFGGPSFEADVLCVSGGAPTLSRDGIRIPNGTGRLEIEVVAQRSLGLQFGHALDAPPGAYDERDADVVWFAPVRFASTTFTLPIGPDEAEGEAFRWLFFARLNPVGADELCYTGVGVDAWSIRIEAIKNPLEDGDA